MTVTSNDSANHTLDRERGYLIGLAYRMLGSRSDAEDVVQEAMLRAANFEGELRSARAFLTTVVTRLCLDELGSARRRRETYVGPYLPEPVLTDRIDAGDDPAEYRESVSVALLVVLERLSPAERAVFVLRDVFDLDYASIAQALERSEASCRKLLQRAREQLSAAQLQEPAPAPEQHAVSTAFFHAIASGDLQALVALLAAEATLCTDHGGKAAAARRLLVGPDTIGRFLCGLWSKRAHAERQPSVVPCWVNGAPGLVLSEDGRVVATFTLRIERVEAVPRVVAISVMRNPDKLGTLSDTLARGEWIAVNPGLGSLDLEREQAPGQSELSS